MKMEQILKLFRKPQLCVEKLEIVEIVENVEPIEIEKQEIVAEVSEVAEVVETIEIVEENKEELDAVVEIDEEKVSLFAKMDELIAKLIIVENENKELKDKLAAKNNIPTPKLQKNEVDDDYILSQFDKNEIEFMNKIAYMRNEKLIDVAMRNLKNK